MWCDLRLHGRRQLSGVRHVLCEHYCCPAPRYDHPRAAKELTMQCHRRWTDFAASGASCPEGEVVAAHCLHLLGGPRLDRMVAAAASRTRRACRLHCWACQKWREPPLGMLHLTARAQRWRLWQAGPRPGRLCSAAACLSDGSTASAEAVHAQRSQGLPGGALKCRRACWTSQSGRGEFTCIRAYIGAQNVAEPSVSVIIVALVVSLLSSAPLASRVIENGCAQVCRAQGTGHATCIWVS